jgi:peptide chain release factor 1
MLKRLENYVKRYDEINEELAKPEICTDIKKMTALSKEQRSIEKIVEVYKKYKAALDSVEDLKEMKKDPDPEIAEMAEMELEEVKVNIVNYEEELKVLLLPKDPNDEKNVIVEIRGAAGGDEANIFAGDLFRMYSRYAESKGWKVEILDAMVSEMGGYSQIEFKVSGESVYSCMKYESGAHRVQRIPVTEANGRIQTSTATVLVMPEAEEIDFELDMNDLRIDTFCSSGPGGQSVNTTKSAVRVTHIPTGIAVASQVHKSQHENKAAAIQLIKTRLYNQLVEEQAQKDGATRQALIGHGDRSEKIRTYNYPQNRVTDHRISFTIQKLDRVMEGDLDDVIGALVNADQQDKMEQEARKYGD